MLILYRNIAEGLVVYPRVIAKNLNEELPFMATEEILMAGVQAGGDRQHLHEVIRTHSQAAAEQVKQHGGKNDLLTRLQTEPAFAGVRFEELLDASRFIGRAPEQVDAFLQNIIKPILTKYPKAGEGDAEEISV